jgi:hypothetical protein
MTDNFPLLQQRQEMPFRFISKTLFVIHLYYLLDLISMPLTQYMSKRGESFMVTYKKGDIYVCDHPACDIEVTVSKGCTDTSCPNCEPIMCCGKPMRKK